MILVLTNKQDISADLVVLRLRERGVPYLRMNFEDAPEQRTTWLMPPGEWVWQSQRRAVNLTKEVTAIWYRRPGVPEPDERRGAAREFIMEQWRMLILGLRSLRNVLWVNDPVKNTAAESKMLQLTVAHSVGFRIPRTCVTNDAEAARSFSAECGQVVVKCLGSGLVEEGEDSYFIFTSEADLTSVTDREASLAPFIVQEKVWPKSDYRVTVVGSQVYAARIPTEADRPIDWRLSSEPPEFVACALPAALGDRCIELTRRLGLSFGAIDVCESGGDFYFLEINPNGEWGWLETGAGLPISEGLARLLCGECLSGS